MSVEVEEARLEKKFRRLRAVHYEVRVRLVEPGGSSGSIGLNAHAATRRSVEPPDEELELYKDRFRSVCGQAKKGLP